MYVAKSSTGKEYEIVDDLINGESADWDLKKTDDTTYHIIKDGQSYKVEVIITNHDEKQYTIRVNGKDVKLELKDQYDLLLSKMGISSLTAKKLGDIKAPMPGLILDIKVAPGDTITKGQAVLILEAMKMENVLKSQGDGVVKRIAVEKGQAVEKGDLLIETD